MPQPSIIHLGGENCVTGSCHLLQGAGLNIMVDCGLAQGNDRLLPMADWPIRPKDIDYLFLTHAHIDHIGRLPELIKNGFAGEIICSHPTKALLVPMLTDAMGFSDLSSAEIRQLSKSIDDLSWGFEYGQDFKLKKGVTFKLGRAGHILGSCFIRFSFPTENGLGGEGKNPDGFYSVIFSGDLGCRDTPILPDPDIPDSCDLLFLESTYGNRLHEGREDRLARLEEKLFKALADNGKVFIPAFSLGRTQEILFELDRLFSGKKWQGKKVPVFVDSPLALKITEIYSRLDQFWDKESKKLQASGDHPFDFNNLYSVARFRDHKTLLAIPGPAIIIAGSGMCTGGRIIDHLISGLMDPHNDIFFVGYQAHGTPGYDMIKYGRQPNGYVRLQGEKIPIRAHVEQLTGYSAHADQQGLIDWVQSMPEKPGRIKLIHGEPQAQKVIAKKLTSYGYNLFSEPLPITHQL
ncbi:MAG: MBL fold metallo-hydrolase [Desulfobulbaceae bacterium]|nr:MBL fold metallo-hydrolase [Desulfobulbaceae bacterium]